MIQGERKREMELITERGGLKILYRLSLLVNILGVFTCFPILAQQKLVSEELSISRAIEMANESSPTLIMAQMNWEEAKENYDSSIRSLNYPKLSLNLNLSSTTSTQNSVAGSDAWSLRQTKNIWQRGVFSGDISLKLSEFTLFNSWLDTLAEKQAEITKESAALSYNQVRRNLRFDVITNYLKLFSIQKEQEIAKRDLAFSKALLRLIQARQQGPTKEEIQTAEQEVSNAEQRLLTVNSQIFESQFNLKKSMGIDTLSEFKLTSEPQYYPLKLTLEQLRNYYELRSQELQSAKLTLESSKLDEEITYRETFPVKIALSGVAWTTAVDYYSEIPTVSTGSSPKGSIEAAVSLGISIPLWGDGGFLNQAKRKKSLFTRKKNEEAINTLHKNNLLELESIYKSLLAANEEIKVTQKNLLSQTQLLSTKMLNPPSGEVQWLELKTLLSETRTVEKEYYQKLIDYTGTVINLSKLIGTDLTDGYLM